MQHRIDSVKRRWPGGLAAVFLLLSAAGTASADDLAIEDVIDLIRSHEQRIQTFSYRCRLTSGRLKADTPEIVWERKRRSGVFDSTVRVRPGEGLYYASWVGVSRAAVVGKNDLLLTTSRREAAYDGKYFYTWYRTVEGLEPPPEDDLSADLDSDGHISLSDRNRYRDRGFLGTEGTVLGLIWMSPYFYPKNEDIQPLSDILRHRVDRNEYIRAWPLESGLWRIHYIANEHPDVSYPYELEITYDPVIGRLVRLEWGRHNAADETFWETLEAEGGKVTGDWIRKYGPFPEDTWQVAIRVTFEYEDKTTLLPCRVLRRRFLGVTEDIPESGLWEYSDIEVNPELTEADFQVTFPKGIQVTDYARGRMFTVGEGLEDDMESVLRFAGLHGLDRREAARQYGPRSGRWHWLVAVNGTAAVIAAVLLFRWYRRHTAAVLILAVLSGLSWGEVAHGRERIPDSWEIVLPNGQRIHNRQCGCLVTMFALQYFDVEFDVEVLRDALPPSPEGIRLLDIVHVLRGYGLETVARKSVDIDGFRTMHDRGWIGIVPVLFRSAGGFQGHYLVTLRDRSGRHVAADILNHIVPIEKRLTEGVLSVHGGTVVFVTASAQERSTGDSEPPMVPPGVRLDRTSVDLGEFVVSGVEGIRTQTVEFELKNESDRPVIVSNIETSCGCTAPAWRKGIILPGKGRIVPVTIRQSAWGTGPNRRYVEIAFVGGGTITGTITGTGIAEHTRQPMVISRQSLFVDATEAFLTGAPAMAGEASLGITADPTDVKRLTVSTNVDWLSADVQTGEADSTAQVLVRARLTEEIRDALCEPGGRIRGVVSLTCRSELPPQEVPVLLGRRCLARAEPSPITLASVPCEEGSGCDSETVTVWASGGDGRSIAVVVVSVESIPEGLRTEIVEDDESIARVRIVRTPDTQDGSYLIRFRVAYPELGGQDTAFVPVRVE